MADVTPENEIEDWLKLYWAGKTPIAVENEVFEPPIDPDTGNPLPFLDIEFPGAIGHTWSLGDPGNNHWRDDGAFQVLVCVPTGWGARVARQYSKEVAEIFRGKTIATSILCYAPYPPVAGKSADGVYHVFTVAIPYSFQYIA